MVLKKISDRIYADTDGENFGNYGAVILEDEIVFIDSGRYHQLTSLEYKRLKSIYDLPVLKVLLTHYHDDHTWGAQAFDPVSRISSAKTYEICVVCLKNPKLWEPEGIRKWAEEVKDTNPLAWEAVQTLHLKIPNIIFENKLVIGSNKEIIMKHVGGHTAGSSIVIVEPEHILFAGDLLFGDTFPYAGDPSCNPDQFIKALHDIENEDYSLIVLGHEDVGDNGMVKNTIKILEGLREGVKESIQQGISPTEFIEQERVPKHKKEEDEGVIISTVDRFFDFYK
jgi:glyoxylase-like metal-dependent hydrolase (beta-lactamase superfamily II)